MITEVEERIITGTIKSEDRGIESGLRPKFLKDYIGQDKVKEKLKIFIKAAMQRKEALDHVLLYG
ncbi:MAG TPA: Holliday junction branch migration DNA helicase RuvB, partial [Oscillospiraceae bacterium]|nr:Holliday junction branch migration DNA helicase RuvB [Oscillospiraceae bacterium]